MVEMVTDGVSQKEEIPLYSLQVVYGGELATTTMMSPAVGMTDGHADGRVVDQMQSDGECDDGTCRWEPQMTPAMEC